MYAGRITSEVTDHHTEGDHCQAGLSEGDKLDIFEKDGTICMLPVVVYPKKYLDELRGELGEVKAKIASGEQPVFDSVDALFAKLEAD